MALPVGLPGTAQGAQGVGVHQLTDQSGAMYITPSRKLSMTPFVQRTADESSGLNVAAAAVSSSSISVAEASSSSSLSAAPRLMALPSVDDPTGSSINGLSSQLPSTSALIESLPAGCTAVPTGPVVRTSSATVAESQPPFGDGFVLRDYVHMEESRRARFWKQAPVEVQSRISAELKALPEQHKTRAHAEKMGWLC